MYAERHVVTIVTDGSGDGTGYTPVVTGRLISIRYVKTDYTDGVDVVVTAESSGQILWDEDNVNASATRLPRQPTTDTLGVAAVYAAGGAAVLDHAVLAQDRVKIVVAAGGAAHTGAFHVVIA